MTKNTHPPDETVRPSVLVAAEDAELIKKIRRVLKTGSNAEVKKDKNGKPKVFRVSREIEQ